MILDLPSDESLAAALGLAKRGLRPVLLFNGVPGPAGSNPAVPIDRAAGMLVRLTGELEGLELPSDAPPAFVLDRNRMAGGYVPKPGSFDNRWMVFPQDFPSGGFLLSHGIIRVVVVEPNGWEPAEDLVHVLLRYREAGLTIVIEDASRPGHHEPAALERPSWFRVMFYRALVLLRLRRNSAGGFGAIVPEARSGGGFYG